MPRANPGRPRRKKPIEVRPWVKQLVEEVCGGAPFKIGDVVTHPDGRKVKIMSGQYWSAYGLSNFWTWREVRGSGRYGKEESGYGWMTHDNTLRKGNRNGAVKEQSTTKLGRETQEQK